jgi:hypothetical protein
MNESPSDGDSDGDGDGGSDRSGADGDSNSHYSMSDDERDITTNNISTPSLEYNYEYVPIPQALTTEQLERISIIEAAATNVQRVLVKYGDASSLPSSLNPDDFSSGKCWEIDPNSPWSDTSSAVHEIVAARERMVRAWSSAKKEDGDSKGGRDRDIAPSNEPPKKEQEWWLPILSNDTLQHNSSEARTRRNVDAAGINIPPLDEPLTEDEQLQFHDVYMEWATNAFEQELDALRKGQLEEFTSARSQTRRSVTTTATTTDAAMGANDSTTAVELDPTQYSFVVTTESSNGDDKRKGVGTEALQEIDVRVLSDMMYSGSNVLTILEKRMLLQARQRALLKDAVVLEDDADATSGLTLHERRKREIGLC